MIEIEGLDGISYDWVVGYVDAVPRLAVKVTFYKKEVEWRSVNLDYKEEDLTDDPFGFWIDVKPIVLGMLREERLSLLGI